MPRIRLGPLEISYGRSREEKRTRAGRAITLGLSSGPIEPRGKSYEKLSKEGYASVITVYACINEICSAASSSMYWYLVKKKSSVDRKSSPRNLYSRKWKIKKLGKENKRKASLDSLDDHPLLELLDNPNEMEDGTAHVFNNIAFYLVAGNAYTEIVTGNSLLDGRRPLELWNHRPGKMKPVASRGNRARGLIKQYLYEDGGQRVHFQPSEIIHRKMFNPTDSILGLSPLQVAYLSVQNVNEARKWNNNLLKNAMRPSGGFSTKEYMDDDVYDRMRSQIDDEYSGATAAGRPLLLEGDMEWVKMAFTAEEMDWIESMKLTRSELCSLYNVPPEIIGAEIGSGKSYNSYIEARKALYEEAVIPQMDRLRAAYNRVLPQLFNSEDYVLDYDRDLIEAIQEERNKLWERTRQSNWTSINEKRDLTGYSPINHPIFDIPTALLGDSGDVRRNARLLAVSDQSVDSEANAAEEGEDPVAGNNPVDDFLNTIGSLDKPATSRADEGEAAVKPKPKAKPKKKSE